MGQQIFDSDGTFTVPPGVTEVTVCMCGGGGGGTAGDDFLWLGMGGSAGESKSQSITELSSGEELSVIIGGGGQGRRGALYGENGDNGGSSSFHTVTANGGLGGQTDETSYKGNSETITTCGGSFNDGSKSGNAYGGQAGAFGNGGDGAYENAPNGGIGAGGGGSQNYTEGGNGGNGRVVVDWDDYVEDGGLLINGTLIPELAADGELHFYCKDHLGNDFDGAVQELMLDGQLVWKEI